MEQLLVEVAAGGGRAVVPHSVADRVALGGVVVRPIAPDTPRVRVAVVTRDEQPRRALAALLDELALVARRPARLLTAVS